MRGNKIVKYLISGVLRVFTEVIHTLPVRGRSPSRHTHPKPLGTKVDSGTIPNGLEGFWIRPSFKDHFLSPSAKPYSHASQTFSSP